MSTIKSSNEDITINADGSGRSVKFQANGVEKASIDSSGNFTSTSIDATKLSGALPAIDGSALTNLPGGGKVLQVVSSAVTSTTYSTNTDTWIDSGLSVSITPSSTSSKILVLAAPQLSTTAIVGAGTFGGVRLLRDSTAISTNERFSLYTKYNHQTWIMNVLDSPSTTSSVTYKVQMRAHAGAAATIESAHHTNVNTIIVLEIGA